MKRIVVTLFLFLMMVTGETSPYFNDSSAQASSIMFSSDIIFVGGSEEGNYSSIQDAIDNASHNCTIYIYQGTYEEQLIINKSVRLTGQKRSYT
jgi:pectin methylesterase-like acyl-CoA thioesterase